MKMTKNNRFLTFFIDDEVYGVGVLSIKEIIKIVPITKVPKTPDFLKGVINLRGKVIPTVDIRLKFGMDEREYDIDTCIIVFEIDDIVIGFIVDRVEDVISLDDKKLQDAPNFGTNIDASFITSIAEIGEDVIMILDLKKIFETSELINIGELHKDKEIRDEK